MKKVFVGLCALLALTACPRKKAEDAAVAVKDRDLQNKFNSDCKLDVADPIAVLIAKGVTTAKTLVAPKPAEPPKAEPQKVEPPKPDATAPKAEQPKPDQPKVDGSEQKMAEETPAPATPGKISIAGKLVQYEFEGSTVYRRELYFADANCRAAPSFQIEEKGTFDVNKDKNKGNPDIGYLMDLNFTTVSAKALDDNGVDFANAIKICNLNNWAKDKAQVVMNDVDKADCYNAKEPRPVFTRYRVDAGTLYLAADDKKSNRETERPDKYSKDVKFKKP